jgi:hypothetical protein
MVHIGIPMCTILCRKQDIKLIKKGREYTMSIYCEYLSQDERAYMIESSSIDNEFDKLQTLYEMASLHFAQLEKEIEHKVFSESGSYDDLAFLLQEAGEENIEKKKGIIAQIIDTIKRFFDKITGKSNKIREASLKPDDMISVPADLEEKSSTITGAMNKMQTGIVKLQSGNFTGALSDLKTAVIPVALVTITGGVAYKQIQYRKGAEINAGMEKAKNFFNGIWDKIKAFVAKLTNSKDVDDANKCFHPIKKILSAIDSVISAISNGITKLMTGKSIDDNKKEADARLLAHNNLLEKRDKNGGKYMIDRTTGKVQYFDNTGKELPVDMTKVPKEILKASQHVKGKASAAAQAAKKETDEIKSVNSELSDKTTFTPKQTGVKVYVDPTTARLIVNGKHVTIPKEYDLNGKYGRRHAAGFLHQHGVTKNYGKIIDAVLAARSGIRNARSKKAAIDAENAKVQRQLRQESVCNYMNEVLANTVLEAVIDDDNYIALVEYEISPQEISDEIISVLESCGYTLYKTEQYYAIYE